MWLSVYHKISSKSVNIGTSDFKSPKIETKDRFFKNIFFLSCENSVTVSQLSEDFW